MVNCFIRNQLGNSDLKFACSLVALIICIYLRQLALEISNEFQREHVWSSTLVDKSEFVIV